MRFKPFLLLGLIVALGAGCGSAKTATNTDQTNDTDSYAATSEGDANDTSTDEEQEYADETANEPTTPNSAAGLAEISKDIPYYARGESGDTWGEPMQFREGTWGMEVDTHTTDDMQTVLDWYKTELVKRGWEYHPNFFKGMESFDKTFEGKGTPKLITVTTGEDEKTPGKNLIRVLLVDQD